MLVKNQLGYSSDDMVLYGRQENIQMMIADKEELGLSEKTIVRFIMKTLYLTEEEAEALYDEMLEDLEKQKQNQK